MQNKHRGGKSYIKNFYSYVEPCKEVKPISILRYRKKCAPLLNCDWSSNFLRKRKIEEESEEASFKLIKVSLKLREGSLLWTLLNLVSFGSMLLFKPANSWKFIPESVYYQSALSDPGHALSFLLTPAFQSFPPLPPQLPTFVVSKPKLLLSCKVSDNLTHKWWTTHSVEK